MSVGVRVGWKRKPVALHVVDSLERARSLGLTRTLERMAHRGIRPVLVTSKLDDFSSSEISSDLPVLRLPGLASVSKAGSTKAVFRLASTIRRLQPTVVHTHGGPSARLAQAATWLARSRQGRVRTIHSVRQGDEPSTPRRRWMTSRDLVICESPRQKAQLHQRFESSCVAVIPPVTIESESRGLIEDRAPNDAQILIAGRPEPSILVAMARAHAVLSRASRSRGNRLRIDVCGAVDDSTRQEILGTLARGGLEGHWRFAPGSSRLGATIGSYRAVFIDGDASRVDAWVGQSLAHGLPVICADRGCANELLNCEWSRIEPGAWRATRTEPRGLIDAPSEFARWLERLLVPTFRVPGTDLERRTFARRVLDPQQQLDDLLSLYRVLPFPGRSDRGSSPRARR